MISENIFPNILCSYIERLEMVHCFRKFISEVFVNGKFPKILPSENFPLYGSILLFIRGGKHLCFSWIASQPWKVIGKFTHINTMKACKS